MAFVVRGSMPLMIANGPGELDPPKSREEACVEWAVCKVESKAGT